MNEKQFLGVRCNNKLTFNNSYCFNFYHFSSTKFSFKLSLCLSSSLIVTFNLLH